MTHSTRSRGKSIKGKTYCRGCNKLISKTYPHLCDNCKSMTAICECGCKESMPYYTTNGDIRRFKSNSHAAKFSNNSKEINNKISISRSARWKDKQSREKNVNALIEAWKNKERREKACNIAKNLWKGTEYRKSHSGENNFRYNPNKGDDYYGDEWRSIRKKILIRDNYTCKICKVYCTSRRMIVHHIIPFASFHGNLTEAHRESNLVCLCISCHGKVHNNTITFP